MFNLVQILDEARISHSVKNERLRYKVAKQGYISEKGIGAWSRDVYSYIKEVENDVMKISYKRSEEQRPNGRLMKSHDDSQQIWLHIFSSWNVRSFERLT